MTTKQKVIRGLLKNKSYHPEKSTGHAFAPTNIALCKYWGKRNIELNLPITSSLSISLASKGAVADIETIDASQHDIFINEKPLDLQTDHGRQLFAFLDMFSGKQYRYRLKLDFNIPVAAGLASSACAFASIVKALNDLYQWSLDNKSLSILARLGSGSACRSIDTGFVEWQCGQRSDGLDSFSVPLPNQWPSLRVGISLIDTQRKAVSSREGMQRTVMTSDLYRVWPEKTEKDLVKLKQAITDQDFSLLGSTAENNALSMHATMLAAWPPLSYTTPETLSMINYIWQCRKDGLELYFTQDAGPNVKLLFPATIENTITHLFPNVEIIRPFITEHTYA